MKSHHPKLSFVGLAFAFLLIFASCEDTFGIESIFGDKQGVNSFQGQVTLMDAIQRRRQISNVSVYDNTCHIKFVGGTTASLRCDLFPIVLADEDKTWRINGESTGVNLRFNDDGTIILPTLTAENGFWFLDDVKTALPVCSLASLDSDSSKVNLRSLLLFQETLYLYTASGDIDAIPIIKAHFYQVPEYWLEHLVEKEKEAETAIYNAEGDCAAFVFFTDAHWGINKRRSPALIRHIVDYTPFSDVIFGGDVITTHSTNLNSAFETGLDFQMSFAFLGTHFHCLYGNHDNNSDSQPKRTDFHLSDEQVYYWLQRQMTDVVYDDYYNYYYDNPATKTRIICLDTGRYYYSVFRDRLPKTVAFAIDALSTLPNGWHAIMASHIWCNARKQSNGTYYHYFEAYMKSILKIFDDYNSRLSGVYRFNDASIPYDFSRAGGSIEFCIGGHTHHNFTTTTDKGIPVIIVISDSFNLPEEGTTNEQSITAVVVDYKHRKLKLFVVGRGDDRCIDL